MSHLPELSEYSALLYELFFLFMNFAKNFSLGCFQPADKYET